MHWPAPVHEAVQFFVQSVIEQSPFPEQLIVQPLPAHDVSAEPAALDVTVHPPPAHERSTSALLECATVHPPLAHVKTHSLYWPSQTNAHPTPSQLFAHVTPWPVQLQPPTHVPTAASAVPSALASFDASPAEPSLAVPLLPDEDDDEVDDASAPF